MLKDLLLKNRSYRRFYEEVRIPLEELMELVELTRWCASGRNAQPLRYSVIHSVEKCAEVFPCLTWAGYLTNWDGPMVGERPVAYLVQLLDTRIVEHCLCDDGIQAQSILLGAVEKGYGGCIIKSFKNEALRRVLDLPEYMKIMYVMALGKPKEKVVIEEMRREDYKYWRDAEGVHHVPKRRLESLVFNVI
ncbi:MAG: nitroreductase family protein [Odoribacter sp.]